MRTELEQLPVLILDFQGTGVDASGLGLLEIGLAEFRARDDSLTIIHSYLVVPPPDFELPVRIQRITGLRLSELKAGISLARARRVLKKTAEEVARRTGRKRCPTVIHFAKYEEAYLKALFDSPGKAKDPFQVVCTHEIARRILPGLPRRGLRAVAGYLGHSVPELRRAGEHVAATAAIWKSFVSRLNDTHGISTWEGLRKWLRSFPASRSCGREYPLARHKRIGLPGSPGVYHMCRADGQVIYVGKASSLRSRVNSYFQKRKGHPDHILEMLTQVHQVDCTVTGSALEAALLESDQIKNLSPPYNRALRGGERTLAYVSRDLRSLSAEPDREHPLGPLAGTDAFRVLGSLVEAATTAWNAGIEELLLERWGAFRTVCAADVVAAGWQEFVGRHALNDGSWGRSRILSLGADLWKARLEEEGIPEEDSDAGLLDEDGDTHGWSSSQVAGLFEGIVRSVARELRKARWLCWLSESTIAWRPRAGPSAEKHLLAVESGQARSFSRIGAAREPSIPRGFRKPLLLRKLDFDLMAYDRLTVLTRELRRLLQDGRLEEVRLGKVCRLAPDQIGTLLQWI